MGARAVEGVVQHYDWGDPHVIPRLLGLDEDGRPWAELWLGTHPGGPTRLVDGDDLSEVTGPLPYLLKVLAAARPLSLQVHPTTEQAADGHRRGVFGDPHAKPELLVALTPFDALCGVRPAQASVTLLRSLGVHDLADHVEQHGPGATLRALYRGDLDHRPAITATASASAATSAEGRLVQDLAERYGHDEPSVTVTLLLNRVRLAPGEALHLTAGNLHAYLHGAGIELMGASDNVVRGGLTTKHVDVDLLLELVDATPLVEPVMNATDGRYPLPEAGVTLVRLEPGDEHTATGHELTVALDGVTTYLAPGAAMIATATTFVVTPLD